MIAYYRDVKTICELMVHEKWISQLMTAFLMLDFIDINWVAMFHDIDKEAKKKTLKIPDMQRTLTESSRFLWNLFGKPKHLNGHIKICIQSNKKTSNSSYLELPTQPNKLPSQYNLRLDIL